MTPRLHTLPNGLSIIVDPVPGAQSAAVGLHAGVGSRAEAFGQGGLAHMLEHMVFKGAAGRSARQIAEAIEDVGGHLNAWTGRDQTVFHARTLAADVPLAVNLIADLLREPDLDADELEREKGVVLSELGEYRDNPEDFAGDLLFEAAFGGQALGRPIIGTEQSVRALTRNDLTDWMRRELVASRLLLVAAGAVDEDALLALAEKRFGDMAASPPPATVQASFGGGERIDARSCEQAHWSFALPGPAAGAAAMPATSIFSQAVGGGMSSRLFQMLREERGLAYSIYSWTQGFADSGLFAVSAATDCSDAAAALALARQIVRAAADDLSPQEVSRARAQIEAGLLMSLETAQGRADHHARNFEIFGRLVPLAETLDEIRAVDAVAARAAGAALHEGPTALACVGGNLALAA
ncbi:M16 family metallopeptidase [Sphingomonas sp. GCM10030256]|uniref:M16 family metallopeptidase n=1 Tax=Sphingomonas sp. GCM10030256 TaxID=3273427 RepID=UPI00361AAAF3